ncbi:F0F1 ATP synthase subunit A [Caviibacter abscessus]|uniref:F0F1 ATP synthase subunit A n=1 Tax=Caviibacter abscessus TaxID=1766719 RepID=UPI00082FB967|nr:F0F1 ATP synthase subunit A [Caviibacter abscessus]
MLKKTAVKFLIGFIGITLIINLILAMFSTFLPIEFLKPADVIEAPIVFYSLNIGKYTLSINQTLVNTWVLMALIIFILIVGTRKLSVENPTFFQLILEQYYTFIDNSFLSNFKDYKKKFMPFFAALFSFILFSNISVFIFPFVMMFEREGGKLLVKPFFRTPTADINTTFGLALIVTVVFITCSFKRQGVIGVLKELCKPFWFMFPINLVGELAKPLSIAMRLFGNMFAGLIIISLLYGISFNNVLSSWTFGALKGSFSFAVGWPALLQIYFDLFIGILQAFIFTVLSSVYVEQALIGEEE